jgi:rubrerythrin
MNRKKEIRKKFRDECLARDKYRCIKCGTVPNQDADDFGLEIHHIVERFRFVNGGYVLENGASLCPPCHLKAEQFYVSGVPCPGFSPKELYEIIGSSRELAVKADCERG